MFIEFKTSDGTGTFVLNAFQIVSINETIAGSAVLFTIHGETYTTSEKYKDVIKKLETI